MPEIKHWISNIQRLCMLTRCLTSLKLSCTIISNLNNESCSCVQLLGTMFFAFYAGNTKYTQIYSLVGRTTQNHPSFWRHWMANSRCCSVLILFKSCLMRDGLGLGGNSKPTLVQWYSSFSKPRNLAHTLDTVDPNSRYYIILQYSKMMVSMGCSIWWAAGLYEWTC